MKKLLIIVLVVFGFSVANANDGAFLRRPVSPERPMFIVHIDTWNYPDPQKIIDMVPEDILPYVVFNLSLSATDNVCCSGPNVCDSWMKVCAQNRVWTLIQPSSGAHNRFSDIDMTDYERYFKEYPNFLGWNFAEQFWDFGTDGWPTFLERLANLGKILQICQQYGGYLVVSFTQAYYSADMNPIAYMKRDANVRQQLTEHPENFICCEKYTMSSCFLDIESNCIGAYIGGYAGQYGIRFDVCGWQEEADESKGQYGCKWATAAGAIPIMEHVMLTGQTVIDGPELIWTQVSKETDRSTTKDGYTRRNWNWFPQYVNINQDQFRKILDGTVRILSRKEVINRTKIVIKNDVSKGNYEDYITPSDLFDGLYRSKTDDGGLQYDNPWLDNRWWFKSTGRYPTIPQVYDLLDTLASNNLTVINKSEYNTKWPSRAYKVYAMNKLFPQEYTGDIYASRAENAWMTYNPYQYDETKASFTNSNGATYTIRKHNLATSRATGDIPFKYNTCEGMQLSYAPYSMGVIREYADKIYFYLSNYRYDNDTKSEWDNAVDTIRIYGVTNTPEVNWNDRANHRASDVVTEFSGNVLTLVVSHNGPLEIKVNAAGQATERLSKVTESVIWDVERPAVYEGQLEYEAEHMDYKDVANVRTNGYYYGHSGYMGQGFVELGKSSSAALRDTVTVPCAGTYRLTLRYQSLDGVGRVRVVANGKTNLVSLQKTSDDTGWTEVYKDVELSEGDNPLVIKQANVNFNVFIDCVKLDLVSAADGIMDTPASSQDCAVESVDYYDITGRRVPYFSGTEARILIKKTVMTNGTIKTEKIGGPSYTR